MIQSWFRVRVRVNLDKYQLHNKPVFMLAILLF